MSKYISGELQKKFVKYIPELPNKITLEELWNTVVDKFIGEDHASLIVGTKTADLTFEISGVAHTISKNRDSIYKVNDSGNCIAEDYNLLILDGLKYIAANKLLKKKKKKEKN